MAKYTKPTLQTKYHIDFNWWLQPGKNLHSYLLGHACDECQALISAEPKAKTIDWIDQETGQIFEIDRLWHTIQVHCGSKPGFIPPRLPLTASIFRLFIGNNNLPLTPVEIYQKLEKKDAKLILRTIGGRTVYKGIRPVTPIVSG